MSTYRLANLLSPHSIALVGASPRQGSVGRAILENIRKAGFKGEFGMVNSHHAEIDGVATIARLEKLPFAPELVIITAPAAAIPSLIDEAGKKGAAGAVIVSAGLGHGAGLLVSRTMISLMRRCVRWSLDRPTPAPDRCQAFPGRGGCGASGRDRIVGPTLDKNGKIIASLLFEASQKLDKIEPPQPWPRSMMRSVGSQRA
jgi:predicted CoA-binding protein